MVRPSARRPSPRGNRPAQSAVIHVHGRDAAADDVRNEAAARGFDFGEFRHGVGATEGRLSWRRAAAARAARLLRRRIYPNMPRRILARCARAGTAMPRARPPHDPTRIPTIVRCPQHSPPPTGRGRRPRSRWLLALAPRFAVAQSDAPPRPAPDDGGGRPQRPAKPSTALTADLMYRLLIGDIALQRGEPALAARAYYEAAREAQGRGAGAARDRDRARGPPARRSRSRRPGCGASLDPAAERPKQVHRCGRQRGGAIGAPISPKAS